MQNQQQDNNSIGPSQTFNWIYILSSVYATCTLPFLRTGMGSHALGFNAFFALLLMFVAGGFMNAPAMMNLIGIWLVAVIFQRALGMWQRRQSSEPVHSRYLGDPWLARIPGISVHVARSVLEPVLTFVVAGFLTPASRHVAEFLMGAAVALFIKNLIDVEIDRARTRRMRDAYIEQVYVSRRYKQGE